jgi:hypothetical protein
MPYHESIAVDNSNFPLSVYSCSCWYLKRRYLTVSEANLTPTPCTHDFRSIDEVAMLSQCMYASLKQTHDSVLMPYFLFLTPMHELKLHVHKSSHGKPQN